MVGAIERAVGPAGTLMMVLGATNEWDWVNAHPEGRFAARGRLADVPSTVRVSRHRRVLDPQGTRIVVVECLDDEIGIVPDERQPAEDYFTLILCEYLATGRALMGTVGDSQSELLDAADIVAFGATWMGANLR